MILTKYLIPAVAVAGIAVGSFGTLKITKAVKPEIKLECPACPSLKCPEPPASNGIDFDKIKNVRGLTIQNHQHFVVDGDSISKEALMDAYRKVALELKLSRCK
jgi:hypothetical protein